MNIAETRYRILVVDDAPAIHADFRKILCPTVTTSGAVMRGLESALFDDTSSKTDGDPAPVTFDVESAYQGEEGLERVRSAAAEGKPYSLVFMDVRMPPGWDGVETITHIWKEHPEVQMVICTAYSDYSWEEMLRKIGETDSLVILKKPFDNVEVLQLAHALTKKWTVTRQANVRLADLDCIVRERSEELKQANQNLHKEVQRRAAVESALRDSEERFRKAFESTGIGLAILRDGRLADVNESFVRLTGFTRPEVEGRLFCELALQAEGGSWDEALSKYSQGSRVHNTEIQMRRKDGETRQTLLSLEPLLLREGPSVLIAVLDVTEQRRLEGQLRQAQKMEAVGQLAAGVAHDFNNLLTIIQGHAALVLSRPNLDKEVSRCMEQVKIASERAATLTRQLLAFGRKQVLQRRPINLSETVKRLEPLLARSLGETITLRTVLPSALPVIEADEPSMEQVITNLVVNAKEALTADGIITLATDKISFGGSEPACDNSGRRRAGDFVRLTIQDTGPGMPAETLAHLFEPFFTTKNAGRSTGLGLATTYAIVQQHSGWIDVESELGKGSLFRLYFPVVSSQVPKQPEDRQIRPTGGKGQTILVVEDEQSLRELVCRILRVQGYTVLAASCGREAQEVWRQHKSEVDLLFTDMSMPDQISGMELAREFLADNARSQDRTRPLEVIYTSGYTADWAGQDLQDQIHFLEKPYGPNRLVQMIKQCLSKR